MYNLKALSINQPWAWAIVYAGKDIENRVWKTNFRGDFFIHAGKKFDNNGMGWIADHFPELDIDRVANEVGFQMGGIIGQARIVDCVQESDSPWFFGPYGFVLENVEPVEFYPCKGMLNFFKVK